MSNLIPTPRSDKNGRIVIRHMKQSESKASDKMPAPALGPRVIKFDVSSERIGVGAKEIASIRNPISRWQHKRERAKNIESLVNASPLKNSDDRLEYSNRIEKTLTSDEVKMSLDVLKTLTRDGVPDDLSAKDRRTVYEAIGGELGRDYSVLRVHAFHSQIKWLEDHPGGAGKIFHTSDALHEANSEDIDENGKITNLETYIDAVTHPAFENFGFIHMYRKGYLLAVAKYPDKIEEIAAYMVERGKFDEDGFSEYTNAESPLAGGAL